MALFVEFCKLLEQHIDLTDAALMLISLRNGILYHIIIVQNS